MIQQLKNKNIGVLITDHNVRETLGIVDKAYILFDGSVIMSGDPEDIKADERVREVYLGNNFWIKFIHYKLDGSILRK